MEGFDPPKILAWRPYARPIAGFKGAGSRRRGRGKGKGEERNGKGEERQEGKRGMGRKLEQGRRLAKAGPGSEDPEWRCRGDVWWQFVQ